MSAKQVSISEPPLIHFSWLFLHPKPLFIGKKWVFPPRREAGKSSCEQKLGLAPNAVFTARKWEGTALSRAFRERKALRGLFSPDQRSQFLPFTLLLQQLPSAAAFEE